MSSEIIIYENQEGNIKIDVRLENETVWLTQEQMGLLFGRAKSGAFKWEETLPKRLE